MNRREADDPAEGNIINYGSSVRCETPQEMYDNWYWPKHGKQYVESIKNTEKTA